jgi:hypothetical protein
VTAVVIDFASRLPQVTRRPDPWHFVIFEEPDEWWGYAIVNSEERTTWFSHEHYPKREVAEWAAEKWIAELKRQRMWK